MPLIVLAPLVMVGIALIVLIVRYSGISKKLQIGSLAYAQELLAAEYPQAKFSDAVFLSVDGTVAIGRLADKTKGNHTAIGLVRAMGDRFIARSLQPDELEVKALAANHLLFKPTEFGMGTIKVRFANAEEVDAVLALCTS